MAAVGPRTSLRIERGNDKRFRGLNAKHTVSGMVEALLQLLIPKNEIETDSR